MDQGGDGSAGRVQEILTGLLKQRLGLSLGRVSSALERWQKGELGPFEVHCEILAHVSRAENLATNMSRIAREQADGLLRVAFDAGLVDREELERLTGRQPDELSPAEDLERDPEDEDGTGPSGRRLPPKKDVVDRLLADGSILVHIDARRPGVSVPERFASDPKLVLRFGYKLTPVIPDLDVGEEALVGTLNFAGAYHRCVLPWSSIYAVMSESDQRGMVWPDDVPAEAMQDGGVDASDGPGDPADGDRLEGPQAVPAKPAGRGSHLKLVE